LSDSFHVIINFAAFRKDRHALFDLRNRFTPKPDIVTEAVLIVRRIDIGALR
jgi:hypothetical protein